MNWAFAVNWAVRGNEGSPDHGQTWNIVTAPLHSSCAQMREKYGKRSRTETRAAMAMAEETARGTFARGVGIEQ